MPLLSSLPILGAPSETTKEFDAFFYKDTERGINLFNISVVRFSRVRRSSFRLRLVLPLRSPPEALAALEGLRLGKVPERTGKETVHEPRKANSSDPS